MFSIPIFIVVLLLLVLVHEFGHFIVAKKAGIRVDEFAFGFPPKLLKIKKGETTYAFNLLPLGGYVKIYGENPNDVIEGVDKSRSFVAQPRPIQALVVVAGIVFNLLFAWILFSGALMVGVPSPRDGGDGYPVTDVHLIVSGVADNSPAKKAGLVPGDIIIGLTDGDTKSLVSTPDDVSAFIGPRGGHELTVSYKRGGQTQDARVTPVSGIIPDAAAIGVYMDEVGTLKLPFFSALGMGFTKTVQFTVLTAEGLGHFFGKIFLGESDFTQVTGPVGIVNQVGDAARIGFANVLLFTAVISINLAIMNLIPFPALDGGRLLFIAIESVIRRPIKASVANTVNAIGFGLLMLLMIVITYHDIVRLIP